MKYLLGLLLLTGSFGSIYSKSIPNTSLKKIASGFDIPWAIEKLSGSVLLVTERDGHLFVYDRETKKKRKVKGLPQIYSSGQGGLLDVVKALDFNKSKIIYFTYSKETKEGSTTALAAGELDFKKGKLSNLKVLFEGKTNSSKKVHYGSRIALSKDYIYIGVGDRGKRDLAQDLNVHNGKVIRLAHDGSVPKSNPFIKKKGETKPEIYSYGHRNPQGIFFIESTGELYVSEHGPRGGDEINKVKPGKNYGWPVITYGKEYWGPSIGEGTKKKGVENPVKVYVPSIAPSSLAFYESDNISYLKNKFIVGALVKRHLNVVSKDGKIEERFYESLDERFRSIKVLKNGNVLFGTDSGDIYEISKKTPK